MGNFVGTTAADLRVLTPESDGYPARLLRLSSPPRRLHLAGPWDHVGPIVAIVGSREANDDGLDFAESLAAGLAAANVAIVSGLAAGIDAAAHRGALNAGGRSGAVLGTGLDRCYPAEHATLQEELRASLGLMSELPPGSSERRGTFAARNRIVAALADAVVVVQGRKDSGALITAADAKKIGVPLGAVPWDPRDELSQAPNALIRKGAVLIRNARDVLALAGAWSPAVAASLAAAAPARRRRSAPSPAAPLPGVEARAFAELRRRPQSLDRVAERAGLSAAAAGAALVALELAGLARREPGGLFRRSRGA